MSNNDWIGYTNLALNIEQSLKLGNISNQLNQLTSINTAMLGNMKNLVNIEVYKLEQAENEKQFKQLLFNLKKFVKTKYDDPLTIALLKNGHCKMIDSLLDNFQRELTSFEDKEYVESIIDSFNEYSSTDVDFQTLGEKNIDDVTLLLSYIMFTDQISAKVKQLNEHIDDSDRIKAKIYTPMQHWTIESLNTWFDNIKLCDTKGRPFKYNPNVLKDDQWLFSQKQGFVNDCYKIRYYLEEGRQFQFIFKRLPDKKITIEHVFDEERQTKKISFFGSQTFQSEAIRIENEVLPKLLKDSQSSSDVLSSEVETSLVELSDVLKKSNAEWINVEKKLLNIMYDTSLPIQGPYQYRKQVIGD